MTISKELKQRIITAQQNEITEHYVYQKLAQKVKDKANQETLYHIAKDEKEHCEFWKQYTGFEAKSNKWKLWKYYWIARIFGITFGIKLMEFGEKGAQKNYEAIAKEIPEATKVMDDEHKHEKELVEMIDEEKLKYVGSIVLGLNDALVELTGALAGFTLVMQDTNIIAVAGLITGIAASFSMAASDYLATKSEEGENPLKSSLYTGSAYIVTVTLLVLPYFLIQNYLLCLIATLVIAVLIIAVFNYYISVVKETPFKKRFTEMAGISLGVAALTFVIGYAIREFLGIEI